VGEERVAAGAEGVQWMLAVVGIPCESRRAMKGDISIGEVRISVALSMR
jgi:hypothetical protein